MKNLKDKVKGLVLEELKRAEKAKIRRLVMEELAGVMDEVEKEAGEGEEKMLDEEKLEQFTDKKDRQEEEDRSETSSPKKELDEGEKPLEEVSPPGAKGEALVKGIKKSLKKSGSAGKANNPWAIAWSQYKKGKKE